MPASEAQSPRIDVHHHFLPDFYQEALVKAGQFHPDGIAAAPRWSERDDIDTMDALGVRFAMLSISSPGVHFGDDAAARDLAHRVNAEAARLRQAHPTRFGWFASTPLPDIEGAIAEASRALDEEGADGICVESNHRGLYLGDSRLNPFYQALNDRRAVLFIHPTSPSCQGCGSLSVGYPAPLLEFMFETTRTVTQMILSGVTGRYPNMRIIVPHAGAALSIFAARVDTQVAGLSGRPDTKFPSIQNEMRKLYYDLAGAPVPVLLHAILQIADPHHILYGSDWPFTPLKLCREFAAQLDGTPDLAGALHDEVMTGNAQALFPRLGRHS